MNIKTNLVIKDVKKRMFIKNNGNKGIIKVVGNLFHMRHQTERCRRSRRVMTHRREGYEILLLTPTL